jgi:hypothetical protein
MTIKRAQGSNGTGLLLTLAVLVGPSAAQAQSLDEIVEAALAATGGREAINRIESVRRTGPFTMDTELGPLGGELEAVIIPNQKVYQSLRSDLFTQTSAWDGTVAWQSDDFTGTVELSGTDAANLRNQSVLDWFQGYQNPASDDVQYRKGDDQQLGGRDHFVVELSAGGIPYRYFIDKETHLVTQIMLEINNPQVGGMVEVTVGLSDYQTFEGVQMPTRQRLSVPGLMELDTTFSETVINGPVDHAIFAKP